MQDFIITNARIVEPTHIVHGASLKVEDGRIALIREGSMQGPRTIDAGNGYVLPGFIDMHSDAIEKSIEPRPNVLFPVNMAVVELDRRLAACGITTMYHSLSFAELEVGLRCNNTAAGIIREINRLRAKLNIHTRIHARFEITDLGAVPVLEGLINDNQISLLSFMDHSPGQGQFRDIMTFKNYYGPTYAKSDQEMDVIIERKLRARQTASSEVISHLHALCRSHNITMASHDDDSAEKIDWLRAMDIGVSEFPVNRQVIRAARFHNIKVCLGSPNVVRGQSLAKNLSAREAIRDGFGDILCSDYAPMATLHAVFLLERLGVLELPAAVRMASLTPAQAMGIDHETGSVEVGKQADLLLVHEDDGFPIIAKTFVSGRDVFSTC